MEKSFLKHILPALLLTSGSFVASGQELDIPATYSLWLKESHPLYDFATQGPCGPFITLRSNKLPLNQTDLDFGGVLEISESGEIITTWEAPMDSSPVAVDGDILTAHIFEQGNEYVYISPDGRITPAFNVQTVQVSLEPCPKADKKHSVNEDLICAKFIDKKSHKTRMLAWITACT
jgi:hypothetical protein